MTGSFDMNSASESRIIKPDLNKGLRWIIEAGAVEAEMRRQDVDRVDFKFCLQWHAHEFDAGGKFIKNLQDPGDPVFSNDMHSLSALIHMMVLEHLELISRDGGVTFLGDVLKDTPRSMQEPCLVALELMKFGVLSGEPFDTAQADRPFPDKVNYPTNPVQAGVKEKLLLSRVMSLVPMKLRNDMWNADVDFDLAAFHSLVRILKRALRQLVEASLASVLLRDLSRCQLLPPGFMCASPKKDDHLQSPALLPTFMLPRACMGIVVRFFLEYQGNPNNFESELKQRFPCCAQALEDLKYAFQFWNDLRRCVDKVAEPLGAVELSEEMKNAGDFLLRQQIALGLA